jgi:mevalonate kinase
MKGPLFYSKILLFGEYGIIKDSKGLSIPYNFYKGALKISEELTDASAQSNKNLERLAIHIESLQESDKDFPQFDISSLRSDVNAGMYFDSSIPQGYGVGSSGALVAAIYDKYAIDKITVLENLTREKLLILKDVFGKIESFFHGKSSGLDPLNSYLSLPILINRASGNSFAASDRKRSCFSIGFRYSRRNRTNGEYFHGEYEARRIPCYAER